MKHPFYFALLAATALLAGCATSDGARERVNEAALAKLQTLEPTGERKTCLPPGRSATYTAVTESKLLIRLGVNDYYVSDLRGRCAGATSNFNRFELVVFGGVVCQNQIVNIVDNQSGFTTGSCALGDFQEMRPREDAAE